MARPIAPTPTLQGEDAKRFVAAIQDPQPFYPPKVDNEKFLKDVKEKLLAREQKFI